MASTSKPDLESQLHKIDSPKLPIIFECRELLTILAFSFIQLTIQIKSGFPLSQE